VSKKEGQRSIFDFLFGTEKKTKAIQWKLCVDGASRGNPGLSGAGIHIHKEGESFTKKGYYLGDNLTNNQAEYLALFVGLLLVKKEIKKGERLIIVSDSQLLIRQLQGVYKVKKPELQKLHRAILTELGALSTTFKHVERESNTVADSLANQGIDRNRSLPLKVLDTLRTYEIYL